MKRIFLTGASSGIGRAIARELIAHGHEVWGTSRDLSRIQATARLHAVQLDLRNSQMLEEVFTRAWSESGGLDVVINNAGSGHFGPTENFPTEGLIDEFQVLVFAQLQLLQLIEQSNPPPRVTVGGIFQAKVAPLIFRFLPQRVRIWGLRKYYGI